MAHPDRLPAGCHRALVNMNDERENATIGYDAPMPLAPTGIVKVAVSGSDRVVAHNADHAPSTLDPADVWIIERGQTAYTYGRPLKGE